VNRTKIVIVLAGIMLGYLWFFFTEPKWNPPRHFINPTSVMIVDLPAWLIIAIICKLAWPKAPKQ
jgi:cation transport ATPase